MNGDDYLLDTDYPMDKILATFTGSFVAGARYAEFDARRTTQSITHGLGDWALVSGSFTTGGSTWLSFGMSNADTTSGAPVFRTVEVTAYCTTSTVVVVASNWLGSNANVTYALQLISRD